MQAAWIGLAKVCGTTTVAKERGKRGFDAQGKTGRKLQFRGAGTNRLGWDKVPLLCLYHVRQTKNIEMDTPLYDSTSAVDSTQS